jgi:hypothetical protein
LPSMSSQMPTAIRRFICLRGRLASLGIASMLIGGAGGGDGDVDYQAMAGAAGDFQLA